MTQPISHRKDTTMKTTRRLNLIAAALAAVLAPTTVHAADTTPAETRAIAEEGFIYGPPVNAFWSLTMYDGKTQLLIKNPINRYLVNSPMLPAMKTNTDGSLTLYIQNKSPGADKEANWLPAPNGLIYLVMRLYWPKETPPSILPAGDGTWKPPGIQLVE
jgi:hypothetical protein